MNEHTLTTSLGIPDTMQFDTVAGGTDIILTYDYHLQWECHHFKTFPYPKEIRKKIKKSLSGSEKDIKWIDNQLGKLFVLYTKEFLSNKHIDMIASHGQTVSHQDGISTIQIGSPHFLSDEYGVPVVHNFRQADIDAGGNGAPLMPFLDWLLFSPTAILRRIRPVSSEPGS